MLVEATPKTYATLLNALNAHFEPMANRDYERFIFCQAKQEAEELLDSFHGRFKELASTCSFQDEQDEIGAQIIQGCYSSKLRENILQESGKPLADILTMERSKELAKVIASHMEAALHRPIKTEQVNVVKAKSRQNPGRCPQKRTKECGYCGGTPRLMQNCQAKGKRCSACGRMNHFAAVCRSSKPQKETAQTIDETRDSEDMDDDTGDYPVHYVFAVDQPPRKRRRLPKCRVHIHHQDVQATIDTGTSIELMAANVYNHLSPRPPLREAKIHVFAYGQKTPIPLLGCFKTELRHQYHGVCDRGREWNAGERTDSRKAEADLFRSRRTGRGTSSHHGGV